LTGIIDAVRRDVEAGLPRAVSLPIRPPIIGSIPRACPSAAFSASIRHD